ncbi:hypothetical protein [Catellatospora tritici]|uniref:hypothetical protein n=1 Tax=Catellatospora tritici TaxID=2851566 RepID=UPI001C2D0172|nr:hypothetical protein [Catellatospora tritici]MBV1852713.1 hypothetical protein [Catellatospora tritici]
MRWLRAVVSILLVSVAVAGATPAYASGNVSDLAVRFSEEIRYTDNPPDLYTVRFLRYNYGPGDTDSDAVKFELQAPTGTVFDSKTEGSLVRGPYFNCTIIKAHTHFRCTLVGSIWLSSYGCDPGKLCPNKVTFGFIKKAKCFGSGRITYSYPHDPKSSNNSARIPAPKSPASCTAKPSPRPAAAAPSASASASPSPSVSALPSDTPSAAPSSVEPATGETAAPSAAPAAGPTATSLVAYGGGVVLLGLGGGMFWWLRRRRVENQADDPADGSAD